MDTTCTVGIGDVNCIGSCMALGKGRHIDYRETG